jgi:hypothetical protein
MHVFKPLDEDGIVDEGCYKTVVSLIHGYFALRKNRVSYSILLYSSVSRNITKLYSLVPKLRKIPVTDERRPGIFVD